MIIIVLACVAGVSMYYLQVYAFYDRFEQDSIRLTALDGETVQEVAVTGWDGIDADSSPIRYRACFETTLSLATLTETYTPYADATPRNAPGWFGCFDAAAIGAALEAGTALAFLGEKNVAFGVDSVIAITDDGRGYVWRDLNNCGEKAYDGSIIGEECPDRAEFD